MIHSKDHAPRLFFIREGVDNTMRYAKPRELVIFTSQATVSTLIKTPSQIWPFFVAVMRDFGMPHRWGWAEDLDLEGGAVE